MRSMNNSEKCLTLWGWIVAFLGTAVYLLTLEPTVSYWDCGEFIATSYKLQVGHPPGAPLYQLLAHCFMLLAGGTARLAWWSNALSAVSGGLAAMFLFWTIARLIKQFGGTHTLLPAFVGAACYMLCDTAWFSAVESEVYSLAMLFCSAIVWSAIRWAQSDNPRWILLTLLLLSLSTGVHLLCLLTLPAVVLVAVLHKPAKRVRPVTPVMTLSALFLAIGLSPWLIIPIRAAANPPVNMGNPSTAAAFKSYVCRDQYEHAPLLYGRCYNSPIVAYEKGRPVYAKEMDMLFPRMWKRHAHAEQYYSDWCGRHGKMVNVGGREYYKPSFGDNLAIFGGYQVGYMYMRYLMWNFAGRYNDRQGFGNLQKGQFITGLPHVDRLYVGTSAPMPESMPRRGHNRYFLLPLLLGIVGIVAHAKRHKRGFWVLFTLFISSSLLLSVYLNHPMYEPRERDYAYILSFYAFAVWIGMGAFAVMNRRFRKGEERPLLRKAGNPLKASLLLFVPLLMGFQNWDDHDRSGRFTARDTAANILNSCDKGGMLFTLGDNDTFPLWYMQQVEGFRTDVHLINLSLLGSDDYARSVFSRLDDGSEEFGAVVDALHTGPYGRMMALLAWNDGRLPVHFTHYAHDDARVGFGNRLLLAGFAYRLADSVSADSVDLGRSYLLMAKTLKWAPLQDVNIDETSQSFLRQYWDDAILAARNLASHGSPQRGREVLDRTREQIPPRLMCDPTLTLDAAGAYAACDDLQQAESLALQAKREAHEQMEYYNTMSPRMKAYIPYTLEPLAKITHSP